VAPIVIDLKNTTNIIRQVSRVGYPEYVNKYKLSKYNMNLLKGESKDEPNIVRENRIAEDITTQNWKLEGM
jgi:hypothetical protein